MVVDTTFLGVLIYAHWFLIAFLSAGLVLSPTCHRIELRGLSIALVIVMLREFISNASSNWSGENNQAFANFINLPTVQLVFYDLVLWAIVYSTVKHVLRHRKRLINCYKRGACGGPTTRGI
jgi:hypothetical protein